MFLTKVNYIDNSTIITAKNLNDIQDNIIQNAEDLNNIQNNIIELNNNSISKDNIINNFTTTEEGFVADARALKVLNDRTLQNNTYVVRKDTYSGVGSIVINVKVKNDGNEHKIPISIYGVDNNVPCFGCVSVILIQGEIYVRGFLQELFVIDMTQIRSKVLQCTGTINEDSVTLTISDFDLYGRYIFSCHDYIIE